ncbi:MAG: site-specific DNA-methyltransferase, partial [Planctomycetia bacterium]|nr:site-specific DNA-methyltransferase [Planctomycetia bacterium]
VFAAEVLMIDLREIGFSMRNWCVWYYSFGVVFQRKFARSHTHLFYFVKPGGEFTFHADAIRVPSARQLIYRDKRAHPKGRIPDNTWILRPQELDQCDDRKDGATADDCWYVPRVCGTFRERERWHGCQMPEKVLERILLACSDPGSRVLDPFAGSGTTLAVAKKLGRRWLGFEISPEYLKQCLFRLNQIHTVE